MSIRQYFVEQGHAQSIQIAASLPKEKRLEARININKMGVTTLVYNVWKGNDIVVSTPWALVASETYDNL